MLCDFPQDLMSRLLTLHCLLLEGIDSADHLVEKHSETPPVDGKAMTVCFDHFRGQVLRRAAECVRLSIDRLLYLTQTEVC